MREVRPEVSRRYLGGAGRVRDGDASADHLAVNEISAVNSQNAVRAAAAIEERSAGRPGRVNETCGPPRGAEVRARCLITPLMRRVYANQRRAREQRKWQCHRIQKVLE